MKLSDGIVANLAMLRLNYQNTMGQVIVEVALSVVIVTKDYHDENNGVEEVGYLDLIISSPNEYLL